MNEKVVMRPIPIGPSVSNTSQSVSKTAEGPSFDQLFQQQLEQQTNVKFSAHALKRLESRQISLDNEDMALLKDAVNKVEAKGAKESLILMDQLALVVSVKNRTVITAVDSNNLKENVFTNIDSAVIVKKQ
ncbi:MAG TPA: flagellar protein [Firmicutes bacterium]|jgi:flagellar operon protein|nr:flagellar protein [Bacillota bacterium]